jgi:plastocyanin
MKDTEPNSKKFPSFKRKNLSRKSLTTFLLAVFIVACIALAIINNQNKNDSQNKSVNAAKEARVSVTRNGFVPEVITVVKGTKVIWVNNDDDEYHVIASNPYPTDDKLPQLHSVDLNVSEEYVGSESEGHDDHKGHVKSADEESEKVSAYSYTFNSSGTFGYHDDLHPTLNGTIIVTD